MKQATKKRKEKLKGLKAQKKAYAQSLRLIEKEIHKLKPKMKKGGGRRKGNANENHLAKEIVAAFEEFGITREDCYRTPSSGGHRFAKKEDPGDLVTSKKLRKLFPFSVEAKHYKDVDLFPFFDSAKNWKKSWKVLAWLKQTVAATKGKLHPMLVFRMNGEQSLCAIPGLYPLVAALKPILKFMYDGEEWYLVRFDRLLRAMVKGARNAG